MCESHIGGFHRPVQKLDDTVILFSRLTQGKTKCKRIPTSVRPARGGTRGWIRALAEKRRTTNGRPYGVFRVPRKRKEMQANPLQRGFRHLIRHPPCGESADAIHALRYPENTSGLRNSSCFPTAAEKAHCLPLPPAAAVRFSPQGEGFGESQPACVPPEAGQEGRVRA